MKGTVNQEEYAVDIECLARVLFEAVTSFEDNDADVKCFARLLSKKLAEFQATLA